MKKYGLLFCILIFIVLSYSNAQHIAYSNPSSDILKAARHDFTLFLKKCIPLNTKKIIGLSPDDNFDEATLGKPLQLFILPREAINAYNHSRTIQSMLTETTMWYFPVIFSGKIKLILYIDKQDGSWEKVGLGSSHLAVELDNFQRQWLSENKNELVLVQQRDIGTYLFHIPQIDSYNLTISQSDKNNLVTRYSALQSFSTTIKILHDRIK